MLLLIREQKPYHIPWAWMQLDWLYREPVCESNIFLRGFVRSGVAGESDTELTRYTYLRHQVATSTVTFPRMVHLTGRDKSYNYVTLDWSGRAIQLITKD